MSATFAIIPCYTYKGGFQAEDISVSSLQQLYNHQKHIAMDVIIKAIHFDMSDKLEGFTNKKIDKLVRRFDVISGVNVNYRLIKPEAAMNKEAGVEILVPGKTLFASKTADSFEEALDLSLLALEPQLERNKDKTK